MSTTNDGVDGARAASGAQRPRLGNVIFANFGAKTRVDTPPSGIAEVRQVRGESRAQEFLRSIFHEATDPGRIARGRDYARNGNVVSFSVQRDRLVGEVAGSQNEPFTVAVIFPKRSAADLEEITAELLSKPGALADARMGILTPKTIEVLFADSPADVRISCDCPDNTLCCKHGVAVLETFAERIEGDPQLLFSLRNLRYDQLEESMQAEAKRQAAEPDTEVAAQQFWEGGELPALPTPKAAPAIDDSDLDALHKAMRTVTYSSIDELRAVSDIEELYDHLVDR
ncbi:SWIM zinc finger family protein [Staphylococcus chromogenes]|nr:SWIM zinc finger family protein [Staphylococcus chromogenes]